MAKKAKELKIGEFNEGDVELGIEELNGADSKVRITMFLDGATLKKFKEFAQLTNGKYQSLLNECLNNHSDKFLDKKLREIKQSIQKFERKKA
jgi:hypothetical protein